MTKTEELYNFLKIKPKEKIICNSISKQCANKTGDCISCGLAIKTKKYTITEKQQLELIKIYLNSLIWKQLYYLPFYENYEEGIAEIILNTWEHTTSNMKDNIKRILSE